jgi:hypothetical protein
VALTKVAAAVPEVFSAEQRNVLLRHLSQVRTCGQPALESAPFTPAQREFIQGLLSRNASCQSSSTAR